jgi:ATP-binding protein involved in chromosome partitioning
MLPIESYGVKVMSIGFFSDPTQAIVWRGPMATKALKQMFGDVWWDELDYLLLDLPPGTGDVHLTIVQAVPVTGAVVVSTPQEVALTDARKGVAMFRLDSINVPVIGLIENMAWFTPAELPNNKYYIFGKDGVKGLAEQIKVPLLGQIPLVQSIRESGDVGRPALLQKDSQIAETFKDLASAVIKEVEARNGSMQPTKKVEITTQ